MRPQAQTAAAESAATPRSRIEGDATARSGAGPGAQPCRACPAGAAAVELRQTRLNPRRWTRYPVRTEPPGRPLLRADSPRPEGRASMNSDASRLTRSRLGRHRIRPNWLHSDPTILQRMEEP